MSFEPSPAYLGRREDPDDEIWDLIDAVSVLKNQFHRSGSEALNEHLTGNIETLRPLLAELIKSVYDDWFQSFEIRKSYAGFTSPYSKLEKSAWRLSRAVLNKPYEKAPVELDPRDKDEPKPVEEDL